MKINFQVKITYKECIYHTKITTNQTGSPVNNTTWICRKVLLLNDLDYFISTHTKYMFGMI